jgi:hypothetical protein
MSSEEVDSNKDMLNRTMCLLRLIRCDYPPNATPTATTPLRVDERNAVGLSLRCRAPLNSRLASRFGMCLKILHIWFL